MERKTITKRNYAKVLKRAPRNKSLRISKKRAN